MSFRSKEINKDFFISLLLTPLNEPLWLKKFPDSLNSLEVSHTHTYTREYLIYGLKIIIIILLISVIYGVSFSFSSDSLGRSLSLLVFSSFNSILFHINLNLFFVVDSCNDKKCNIFIAVGIFV